jgi:lysophospholipase L1-like esterase
LQRRHPNLQDPGCSAAESGRRLAVELAVVLVDVYAAFTAKEVDEFLLDGMQPNAEGHQLIAELLVPVIPQQLRRRVYLPMTYR